MDRSKIEIKNIKKDRIFEVPEHYFEDLPMKIQSRIAEESKPSFVFNSRAQFAWGLVAAMIILGIGFVFYQDPATPANTEVMLAEVSTADMVAYLESSDMTVFDMLDQVDVAALLDEDVDSWDYLNEDLSMDEIDELYEEIDRSSEYLLDENTI